MGKELAEKYAVARAVFEEADKALGFSISKMCFEGTEEDLKQTANTQPAILTCSVAAFRVAAEKGLQIHTDIAPDVPEEIETDPQRLEQILKNFLSNAVKFTDRGEVTLSVSAASQGGVAFTVRDTGIGIPEDQQETPRRRAIREAAP